MNTTKTRAFFPNGFEGLYGFVDQPLIRDTRLKYIDKTTYLITAIWRKFIFLIQQLKFGSKNGNFIHKTGAITEGLLS